MKHLFLALLLVFPVITTTSYADEKPGGVAPQSYTIPSWFKLSFLNIPDDIAQAAKHNKKLMVFFHLKGCPYCARMLKENFRTGSNRAFIEKHFDVIAVNVRGDEEIKWVDKTTYTEKTLVKKIGIYVTPTIIVFDTHGKIALRVNGLKKPGPFRQSLDSIK